MNIPVNEVCFFSNLNLGDLRLKAYCKLDKKFYYYYTYLSADVIKGFYYKDNIYFYCKNFSYTKITENHVLAPVNNIEKINDIYFTWPITKLPEYEHNNIEKFGQIIRNNISPVILPIPHNYRISSKEQYDIYLGYALDHTCPLAAYIADDNRIKLIQ